MNWLWAILGINAVMYIITLILFYHINPLYVVNYLALRRDLVWPYLWTIITSMFTHSPTYFLHIIVNMWMLYFFGSYIIRLIGERRFLLVYFAGGIAGGLLFILLSNTAVIGASGAVFALGAMLAVLNPKMRVIIFPLFIPIPLWVAILFGFVITSFLPGVAWQGHLGGAVVGLAFGFYFRRRRPPAILFY